jgi:translation initiation factor IF-1
LAGHASTAGESGASGRALQVDARVVEALPNAMYRVELEDASRSRVTAHVAAAGLLRVLPGEAVVVELMPYDATRGRIVRRRA